MAEHEEVCEWLRKWANAIAREEMYSDLQVYKEDLHDGKITYRFSLTPKSETTTETVSERVSQ